LDSSCVKSLPCIDNSSSDYAHFLCQILLSSMEHTSTHNSSWQPMQLSMTLSGSARVGWGRIAMGLHLWFLSLWLRQAVVSATNTTVTTAGSNGSLISVTSGAACRAECPGMTAFDDRMAEVLKDSKLNPAETCHAVQIDFELVNCVLDFPATCLAYHPDFDGTRSNCKTIGVDITRKAIKSNYTAFTCQMCVESSGALGQRTYWDKPSLSQCEALCSNSATCSAFDYDPTRSMCRTWTGCGPNVRTERFGCQWTVYARPGFKSPTQPSSPQQPPPKFNYWDTTPGDTTPGPTRPATNDRSIAVVSAAVTCRGQTISKLALLALSTILAVRSMPSTGPSICTKQLV